MRYIRYAVLGSLAIVLVTVALANRGPMTLRLLPASIEDLFGVAWQVTLPVFLILAIAVAIGVFLGFVWEWVREHKHRAEASTEKRKRRDLEQRVKSESPPRGEQDEILALVENR